MPRGSSTQTPQVQVTPTDTGRRADQPRGGAPGFKQVRTDLPPGAMPRGSSTQTPQVQVTPTDTGRRADHPRGGAPGFKQVRTDLPPGAMPRGSSTQTPQVQVTPTDTGRRADQPRGGAPGFKQVRTGLPPGPCPGVQTGVQTNPRGHAPGVQPGTYATLPYPKQNRIPASCFTSPFNSSSVSAVRTCPVSAPAPAPRASTCFGSAVRRSQRERCKVLRSGGGAGVASRPTDEWCPGVSAPGSSRSDPGRPTPSS